MVHIHTIGSSSEEYDSCHKEQVGEGPMQLLKCIYCQRKKCSGCPLPFEDKMSLRSFLSRSKVPTKSSFYFQDDDTFNKHQQTLKKLNSETSDLPQKG